ncbi:MAG: CarD family transcriptional regulator [Peptoniphilaceae bacterium]|uniref:CarD family transcriptional regulator n=1 Tax=Parvimonas sp. TaxID=1944660 RepID=UPI0025FB6AAE|nr:CarD family transcriptional regulator [Parvimonas sp.]MCI5997093.1 CarD family transcriptional regulator [Parvimonas sp.]MDD7765377.1 CarD family transcriptional regulator [Peptoniphilaceae bacterium]MDY3051270.1 CarD family transcriptional regulator [Parvimonas sp.]
MNIGDKIFYSMHGAGYIKDISKKEIDNECEKVYVIEIPCEQNLHIMVSEKNINRNSIRNLVDKETLENVYDYLNSNDFPMPKKWNERYKENISRLKSLNIYDVAYVLKGLAVRNGKKNLSIKELFMFNLAKKILVSEFVMVSGFSESKINKIIDFSMQY